MMKFTLHRSHLKPIIVILVLIVAASLLLWLSYKQQPFKIPRNEFIPPKHLYQVEETAVPQFTSVMGSVIPKLSSLMSAEVAGQIQSTEVELGQAVQAHQILATIEDQTYLAELSRAERESESLKVQLNQRKDLYERIDRLKKKDAATPTEWEKVKSDYLATLAQFEAAQEQVSTLQVRYNKSKITAPYDGIVGNKLVEEGDFVSPGTPLFLVYTTGPMDIEFFVPERYIRNIEIGNRVKASIELAQINTTATITQITPYEETNSRTFRVKASLNDYLSNLTGAFVRVEFPVGNKQSLLVPHQAVQRIGQLELIHVLEGDIWSRRYIRTGSLFNGQLEVLSGLNAGEVIGYE